jgi:ribonuclease-3
MLSKGEEKQGGKEKDAILADTLEAMIGSWYLIHGFEAVQ